MVNARVIPIRKTFGATGAAGPPGSPGLTGPTGPSGPTGLSAIEFSAIVDSNVVKGQPVYILDTTGHVDLALALVDSAGDFLSAKSIAVASNDYTAGNSGTFVAGTIIERSDWTIITGFTNLQEGYDYFLDAAIPGMLTVSAPTADGEVITRIGRAATATQLIVDIESPLIL